MSLSMLCVCVSSNMNVCAANEGFRSVVVIAKSARGLAGGDARPFRARPVQPVLTDKLHPKTVSTPKRDDRFAAPTKFTIV